MTSVDDRVIRQLADMRAVYRMFNARGQLLYVGMSGELGIRIDRHDEKRWFPEVATIRLEWFPTEAAARLAEQRAIRSEHPRYNIVGKERRPPVRPSVAVTLRGSDEVTLCEAIAAGVIPRSLAAARKNSTRDPGHPRPVGQHGVSNLYNVDELRAYEAAKTLRSVQ
jgi:hypothetical protein